jgi:hypothetical protein
MVMKKMAMVLIIFALFPGCQQNRAFDDSFWREAGFTMGAVSVADTASVRNSGREGAARLIEAGLCSLVYVELQGKDSARVSFEVFIMQDSSAAFRLFWEEAPNSFVSCDIVSESYCLPDRIGFWKANRYYKLICSNVSDGEFSALRTACRRYIEASEQKSS